MPLQQAPAAVPPARDSIVHSGTVATVPGHVEASGPARLLFEQDKLYTVVAVLLLIWLGLAALLLRNDRRLSRLERAAASDA